MMQSCRSTEGDGVNSAKTPINASGQLCEVRMTRGDNSKRQERGCHALAFLLCDPAGTRKGIFWSKSKKSPKIL
jgi:hypothetical protein